MTPLTPTTDPHFDFGQSVLGGCIFVVKAKRRRSLDGDSGGYPWCLCDQSVSIQYIDGGGQSGLLAVSMAMGD